MKRYCDTPLEKLKPCPREWRHWDPFISGPRSHTSCEDNCANMIDENDMHCPYCSEKIGRDDEGYKNTLRC